MIYRVFIDDSGAKEYKNTFSSQDIKSPPSFIGNERYWRDNYFVMCGMRLHQKNISPINNIINGLKIDCFGTTKVELKSDWLRNPYQHQKGPTPFLNRTTPQIPKILPSGTYRFFCYYGFNRTAISQCKPFY